MSPKKTAGGLAAKTGLLEPGLPQDTGHCSGRQVSFRVRYRHKPWFGRVFKVVKLTHLSNDVGIFPRMLTNFRGPLYPTWSGDISTMATPFALMLNSRTATSRRLFDSPSLAFQIADSMLNADVYRQLLV